MFEADRIAVTVLCRQFGRRRELAVSRMLPPIIRPKVVGDLLVAGASSVVKLIVVIGSVAALTSAGLTLLPGRREGVYEWAGTTSAGPSCSDLRSSHRGHHADDHRRASDRAGARELGMIVPVRTCLSISLDIELEGVVPWRRRAVADLANV
jgi:hypothetical protein